MNILSQIQRKMRAVVKTLIKAARTNISQKRIERARLASSDLNASAQKPIHVTRVDLAGVKFRGVSLALIALCVAQLLYIGAAQAQESPALIAHVGSYHSDRSQQFQETNPGLGVRAQIFSNWLAEAGVYHNSYRETTVYAAASWLPLQAGPVRVGVFGAAVTGYKAQTGYTISPVIGAETQIQVGQRIGVVLRYIPPAPNREKSSAVITFSMVGNFR